MLKSIRLPELDIKQVRNAKKTVFVCDSHDQFLQYFCFLAIKKQLTTLSDKTYIQTHNSSYQKSPNTIFMVFNPITPKKSKVKFTGFFGLDNAEDDILKTIIVSIFSKPSSREENQEIFYLDNLNPIKNYLLESPSLDQCFVIEFYNNSWNNLKKIIDYIFNYFNITPTKLMLERAYYTFLPSSFYELFAILNIVDLATTDKNTNLTLEKTFLELIKNVIQKRKLKAVIKKDMKTFFYWKNKQNITSNREWKSFLQYQMLDVLKEDLGRNLKIEEKVKWWDELISSIRATDLLSVKENITKPVYNLFLSQFIIKYNS